MLPIIVALLAAGLLVSTATPSARPHPVTAVLGSAQPAAASSAVAVKQSAKQLLGWVRRTPAEGRLGVEPKLGRPFVEVAVEGEAGLAARTCREGRSGSLEQRISGR